MPNNLISGDQFGYAVAIDGDTAVIGTPFANSQAGVAYIFVRTAEGWIQQAKLIASDTRLASHFGWSVAINGNMVVIGAPLDNSRGAAYVFMRHSENWQEQDKLIIDPSESRTGDLFGYAVAIRGNTIVIGDPKKKIKGDEDPNKIIDGKHDVGRAYVFVRNGTNWQEFTLPESLDIFDISANAFFGGAVAISEDENTVLIGAPGNTNDIMGAAYVFNKREGSNWISNKLVASNARKGNKFGISVAISGNIAVVGSMNDAVNDTGETVGATYVFGRDDSNGWTKQVRLTAQETSGNDKFGISVAISNNTLLVGASEANEVGKNTGITYIYTRRGIVWQPSLKLIASDVHPNDRFGNAVAISEDTAVFGAFSSNGNIGSAYVTNVSTALWPLRLSSHHAYEDVAFGVAIAMSGDTIVVGAPFDDRVDGGEKDNSGAAYVFVRKGTIWEEQAKLIASDGKRNDKFGMSVAISNNTIVVGAPHWDATASNLNVGAAYLFVREGTEWEQQTMLIPSDISQNDSAENNILNVPILFGASVAISGDTVVVGAPGKLNWKIDSIFSSIFSLFAGDISAGGAYVFVRKGTNWNEHAELDISNVSLNDIDKVSYITNYTENIEDFLKENTSLNDNENITEDEQLEKIASNPENMEKLLKLLALAMIPVAIEGNIIAIGTPLNDNVANDAGLVYIFERIGANWPQTPTYTLTPRAASENELFGNAVAINGNTMVVGAMGIEATGYSSVTKPPKAYVFKHDGTTWMEQAKLTTGKNTVSGFGVSVAISGNTIVIGAPLDNMPLIGAIYEFVYDDINWSPQPKLAIANAGVNSAFGLAVAINGNAKVIGMPGYGNPESQYQGMAYVFPSLTLPSAIGGHYAAESVPVELTCRDCQAIHYTVDGSSPTTASPIYAKPIDLKSTTTLKYFSVGASAGAETTTTQTYVIDTIHPTVSIKAPENGATIKTIEITAEASDEDSGGGINQLDRVEMAVQEDINTKKYAHVDQQGKFRGFTDEPVWIKTVRNENEDIHTENWSFPSSTVPFQMGNTYQITARAVDLAGNVAKEKIVTFTYGELAHTTLSIDLGIPDPKQSDKLIPVTTIRQNDPIVVTGKLSRPSDSEAELSDLPIILTIKSCDDSREQENMVKTNKGETDCDDSNEPEQLVTIKTNTEGEYEFNPSFTHKGKYSLQASFEGTELLKEASSDKVKLDVGPSAGYAILVQGRNSTGQLMEAYNKSLNRVYQTLKKRLFEDDNIRYFNYNLEQDYVNVYQVPNKLDIQNSIESWVNKRLNGSPAPFYLIMIDHGNLDNKNSGSFYLHPEFITAGDLNTWLDTLEKYLTPEASKEPRIIILGTCYSGSFIPKLAKPGRVIITSTKADELSHTGPPGFDDNIPNGEYFIKVLFDQLGQGKTFGMAFEEAIQETKRYTTGKQHPLLDDDGNKIGSELVLAGDGDGSRVRQIHLGVETQLVPLDIMAVTETRSLDDTETSALLWLITNDNDPKRIRGRIQIHSLKSVDTVSTQPDDTAQITLDLPMIDLTFNSKNSRFEAVYDGFHEPGKYKIFYYAGDLLGNISPVYHSVVYKHKSGNQQPAPFSLSSPENNATTRTTLPFDWEDTTDPDGDSVTYSLVIGTDSQLQKEVEVYREEEITYSVTYIDGKAKVKVGDEQISWQNGLKDKTTYYWRIEAIDSFGAKTVSEIRSFTTDNTSAPFGIQVIDVRSVLDGGLIKSATVTTPNVAIEEKITERGYIILRLPEMESIEILVSAFGFTSITFPTPSVADQTFKHNVRLHPLATVSLDKGILYIPAVKVSEELFTATLNQEADSQQMIFTLENYSPIQQIQPIKNEATFFLDTGVLSIPNVEIIDEGNDISHQHYRVEMQLVPHPNSLRFSLTKAEPLLDGENHASNL
jgi:hypothetical protein